MRRLLRVGSITVAVAAVVLAAGCSEADTAPNTTGMNIANGPFSAATVSGCVPPSTLKYEGAFDDQVYFPEGQRPLNFSNDPNADFPPLSITTNDSVVLPINAVVTFHLNTSCKPYTDANGVYWPYGILQKFYSQVALQDQAFATHGDQEPGPGWDKMLATRIAAPIERAISNQALNFSSTQLTTDPAAKALWEQQVMAEIPKVVKQVTGEDYLLVDGVLIQKPGIPANVQAELLNKKAAEIRAQTSTIDQQAAANFPGGLTGYLAYLGQQAVNKAIADGKAQIVVNGGGSPLIVNGTK